MSEGEKTQAATPKRRADALKEGNVWQPREIGPAAAVLVAALLVTVAGERLWWGMAGFLAEMLAGAGAAVSADDMVSFGTSHVPWQGPVVLAVGVMLATGGLAQAAARHVSLGLAAPKFSRLSPVKGLQRIFSAQGLTGAGTALLKLAVIGGTGAVVLLPLVGQLAEAGEGVGGVSAVGSAVVRLLGAGACAMLVVAMVDAALGWWSRERKLMMSLDEVKRESRQDNGAPELKAAIRRAQYAAARRRLQTTLAEASVVLVNPAHFAVALRYRPGEDAEPVVLEKGREEVARAIIAVAQQLGRPVVRSPRLARALFFTARVGQGVREELYVAVATVLAFVMRVDEAARDDVPAVEVPPEFDFDETGARRKPGAPLPL
ncbi:flagellar biosynthetic protein FlhB [Polymorphobacter multimanifer]|uniref:Flagellar biosynthetic protein FlhB n=1 Tax=Polymorphobacter multimanifer TaxID=1070431 RepID=A0A841LB01_9SPHN|nr:EscU/YscU/HrcU family type III secretion system export apparatus switch protein [Polymorphobacter multimanifer]MBB6226332.1 flagellar biosynthetic protein FlhB [Polymorphobacter multimanifer]